MNKGDNTRFLWWFAPLHSRTTHVWGQVGSRLEDWAEQSRYSPLAEPLVCGPLGGCYQAQKSWRREESTLLSLGHWRRIGQKSHQNVNSPKDLILSFADVCHLLTQWESADPQKLLLKYFVYALGRQVRCQMEM